MNAKHVSLLVAIAMAGFETEVRAQTTVDLGSASGFAVLAGSAITFSGATTITGDIGSYPTATITGIGNVTFLSGSNHAGDAFTQAAKVDLSAAYSDAAGRTGGSTVNTELGGTILSPGVYKSSGDTFAITGDLTLNGSGVYIFQMASTLSVAANSQVLLTNGALASSIFWQVGTTATFLTSAAFSGNVLANTSINVGLGTLVDGRLLAQTGAVTFDGSNSAAIPEPAAYALLAGLVTLAIVVIRRRLPGAAAHG